MLELLTYKPAFGEPSGSPFCVKAMCLLKMSALKWKPVFTLDPRKTPMGKLPVLHDDGNIIADSHAIKLHLEREYNIVFDSHLSDNEKAQGHALRRLAEDNIYFLTVSDRWGKDANWKHVSSAFFAEIPSVIRPFVSNGLRKQANKGLHWMGLGRLSDKDQLVRLEDDLNAITQTLGDKRYLFGETAGYFDVCVVPQLRALAAAPEPTPLSRLINDHKTLQPYMQRFKDAFYPMEGG